MRIAVRQISGSLGGSDVTGTVDIDATTKRPNVRADLVSRHLLLKDFAALTGSKARAESLAAGEPEGPQRTTVSKIQPPANVPHLFPTAHLQVDRMRAVDADVRFHATSIEAGPVPFKQVILHAKLDEGVLRLEPLRFDMAQGLISGDLSIDARAQPPQVHADFHAANVELAQLKSKATNAAPPLDGVLDARAVIDGTGDSVHGVMSDANGRFTIIVPQGDVRAAFAELAGIDVAEGIGLLLKKPDDKAAIRCGVAQFDVKTGTAHAQDLLFDTQNVLIEGEGQIHFASEKLDLTIQGQPKKLRLVRLRAPIEIRGELLEPSFKVKPGHLIEQGAIGAIAGTLLTPLAAIVAFVDPGLAKDQNCAQLLAQAQQRQPTPPTPGRTAQAQPPSTTR
jgi:hypothetical protein